MTEPARELLVDARGLRCPWPVLRLARAMREGQERSPVRVLADDPAAPAEIAALAAERGWQVERAEGPITALIVTAPVAP